MSKILMVSHSPVLPTGFGRVTRAIADAFIRAGHEVTIIGLGHRGTRTDNPCKIVPADPAETNWGQNYVADAIEDIQPDVLFTLTDPWSTQDIIPLRQLGRTVWVAYFPIDGGPIPSDWHDWLRWVDIPVTMSKWAASLVDGEVGIRTTTIPHGVDTIVFRPTDKPAAKLAMGVKGKFVVGCVAKNQQRKNIPALIEAFGELARNKGDVAMLLHTPVEGEVTHNIPDLLRTNGVSAKVFTGPNYLDDQSLSKLYNAMDLFVLPTMGEGFGLPIIEAQACGVPVLVTDCSACSELVPDHNSLLPVTAQLTMQRNIKHALISPGYLANAMLVRYLDWTNGSTVNREMGDSARRFAQNFDWSKILPAFVDLIDKAAARRATKPTTNLPRFQTV